MPVALDGLGQDNRWFTRVIHRSMIGRIHLKWVVPTAIQTIDVFIRLRCSTMLEAALRVLTEEMCLRT